MSEPNEARGVHYSSPTAAGLRTACGVTGSYSSRLEYVTCERCRSVLAPAPASESRASERRCAVCRDLVAVGATKAFSLCEQCEARFYPKPQQRPSEEEQDRSRGPDAEASSGRGEGEGGRIGDSLSDERLAELIAQYDPSTYDGQPWATLMPFLVPTWRALFAALRELQELRLSLQRRRAEEGEEEPIYCWRCLRTVPAAQYADHHKVRSDDHEEGR